MFNFKVIIDKKDNSNFDYKISEEKNKFYKDNVCIDSENIFIIFSGIVFEKKQYGNWGEDLINLYIREGERFYEKFRGSFCGVIYDKIKKKWIIFSDHIGSKVVFYEDNKTDFIISMTMSDFDKSSFNDLDINAVYMLLSYGFMLNDSTLSKKIKRILPGQYIVIENNIKKAETFHIFNNNEVEGVSESEHIEKLDMLFRQAIKRQFEKDIEYGFKHIVGLSGGLDSRMTSWVAHEMGYTNQINFTFSQNDYLDETIAKEIASDLKHEWIFKSLDNGLFLKEIDPITNISGGNSLYSGLAHSRSMLKYLNYSEVGIIHTGQFGDATIATYSSSPYHKMDYSNTVGAYSLKYIDKINFKSVEKYKNEELFKMHTRGFLGMSYSNIIAQNYTETYAPFQDIDFFEYVFSIPVSLRYNSGIYKKWILKKYPSAAEYIWEGEKMKIDAKKYSILGRSYNKIQWKNIFKAKLKAKLGVRYEKVMNTKNHMNPLDYWYNTNEDLNLFFNMFFNENIEKIIDNELREDLDELFRKGTTIEKTQVLSVLSAVKIFFSE